MIPVKCRHSAWSRLVPAAILLFPMISTGNVAGYQGSGAELYVHTLKLDDGQGFSLFGFHEDGSLILGISGSGLRGISGSGLRGISGSGLRGISGSGLRGISGSGLRSIIRLDEPLPIVAIGPISRIARDDNSIALLGQNIVFDDQTVTILTNDDGPESLVAAGRNGLESLQDGDYVVVAGENMDSGESLGTVVIQLSTTFVNGSSPVYLRTIVDSILPAIGGASSGATNIDFSGALHDDALAQVPNGSIVEYFGYTSGSDSTKLFATYGGDVSAEQGISGSGLRGISGSGLRGISGSGLRGISGSGLRGISGSGLRGISGSGLRGISGSGLRGISGSGLR
jgi:hypothetical protein